MVVGRQGILGVEDGIFFVAGALGDNQVVSVLFFFEDLAFADRFIVIVDVGDLITRVKENSVIHQIIPFC